MKKALALSALGLAAVVTLTGCAATDAAAEAPLAITGAEVTYPGQVAQRAALIEQYLAGANVADDLAAFCRELAIVDGVTGTYAEQWLLGCETPDYVWDAYTDTWVPAEQAIVND